MRRSKSIETLLPILYLKGISTGDFSEALAALLGKDAAGLSASAIGRLKDGWLDEHTAWQRRDLSAKRYVYIWADGIHLQARLEDEKQCILVLIGATPEGRKELGRLHRWRPRERAGLARSAARPEAAWAHVPPRLVIADGALGFWKAAGEVWPKTREQRCWVHRPPTCSPSCRRASSRSKRALQEIWMAETKAAAELAFDAFIESYTLNTRRRPIAAQGSRPLLAFYDFPGRALGKHLAHHQPHRKHFRHRAPPHDPIEGLPIQQDALAMVFKLVEGAQKSWRRLDGNQPSCQKTRSGCGHSTREIEVIAKPGLDRQPHNRRA